MSLGSSIFKWVQGLVGITDSNGDQIDSTDDLSTSAKRLNVNTGTERLLNGEMVSRVSPKSDYYTEARLGRIAGARVFDIAARAEEIDVNDDAILIWDAGVPFVLPENSGTIDVSSDNAADTFPAGTGATLVTIFGLDDSFNEVSENVSLNGTTAVTTSNSYYRVNLAIVTGSGSSDTNVGAISLVHADTATLISYISHDQEGRGNGFSNQANYTVPVGKTLLINDIELGIRTSVGSTGNREGDAMIRVLTSVPHVHYNGTTIPLISKGSANYVKTGGKGQKIRAGTDILIEFKTRNNNTAISCEMSCIEIDDE